MSRQEGIQKCIFPCYPCPQKMAARGGNLASAEVPPLEKLQNAVNKQDPQRTTVSWPVVETQLSVTGRSDDTDPPISSHRHGTRWSGAVAALRRTTAATDTSIIADACVSCFKVEQSGLSSPKFRRSTTNCACVNCDAERQQAELINLLATDFFFQILAHPVFKM